KQFRPCRPIQTFTSKEICFLLPGLLMLSRMYVQYIGFSCAEAFEDKLPSVAKMPSAAKAMEGTILRLLIPTVDMEMG
ncbi:MAG: hypothetical protein U9P49_13065, partial [Thermodesulfobacteriota bacterium]|nr:hypothetical protein [Thermodesulfobacteriota bacterium]